MHGGKAAKMLYFFTAGRGGRESQCAWRPNMDVYETEDTVVVEMEVPGVEAHDLSIIEHYDRILVRGMRQPRMSSGPKRFQQIEIVCGEFEKEIILPESLRGASVEASLALGILSLKIARRPAAGGGGARRIEIEAE